MCWACRSHTDFLYNMSLPDFADVLSVYAEADGVLQVTLSRPDVGNAINTQMGQALEALWSSLTEDPGDVRCVLLTGSGEKVFCAGGDLKERNGMSREQWNRQHQIFERAAAALIDCPLPVLAAVNGHAYGGGLELAMCCDFIYASEAARFALPEVTLGIMPGMGGTQNLPRIVGQPRAMEVLMTGQAFSAHQALEWGLVNRTFPSANLLAEAINTAKVIARNAPLSIRQIKKSVRLGCQMELRTAYRFEVEAYNHLVDTEDRREGVLASNEKRVPSFRGV